MLKYRSHRQHGGLEPVQCLAQHLLLLSLPSFDFSVCNNRFGLHVPFSVFGVVNNGVLSLFLLTWVLATAGLVLSSRLCFKVLRFQ